MAVSLKRDRTKPQDSPMLWLSVLAGSLAMHLIVLLIGRWYFSQSASAPARGNPAAIEFVEIDPNAVLPSRSVAPSKSASTAPLPKSPASANSPQPAPPPQSQLAQAPPLPENPAPDASSQIQAPPTSRPSPQPEATSQSRPERTPNPARPAPPKQGEPVQPSPAPPASDRQPPNSSPTETPSPSPDSSPGSGNPGSSPSPESGNPGSPGSPLPTPPVPGSPGNPAPDSGDPVTGRVPVDSNLEGAASFAVTVSNATLGADVPDRPDRLAQPTTLTQVIESSAIAGECLLTPEATNFYTQTVTLRLTINDQGKVEGTPLVLNSGSGSSDYDALAQCAIKRWEFKPAYNVTADGKQNPVMSNLDLSVRIEASGK